MYLSDRHKSIGADGILFVTRSSNPSKYDIRFRIFVNDGTEDKMCGNGIRCFAKYVYDNGLSNGKTNIRVETLAGLRLCEICKSEKLKSDIKVYMGTANFIASNIPLNIDTAYFENLRETDEVLEKVIYPMPGNFSSSLKVSMTNVGIPHCVILTDNIHTIHQLGPILVTHPCFPHECCIHCVKIDSIKNEFWSATWECNQVGHTLACGTGATSCALVGVKLGKLRKNEVINGHLEGGDIKIVVSEDESGKLKATMQGEAVKIFEGSILINF